MNGRELVTRKSVIVHPAVLNECRKYYLQELFRGEGYLSMSGRHTDMSRVICFTSWYSKWLFP